MDTNNSPRSNQSTLKLAVLSILVTLLFIFVFFEVLLRFAMPQPVLYPRWDYSREFGLINKQSVTMVNEVPGQWHFEYTTNANGYRGEMVGISNRYPIPNVVILGDSFSFGIGVNDGEDFASVLDAKLDGKFNVVNLGVSGFGLAHQIRMFYQNGLVYQPEFLIIQFTANDPRDNIIDPVAALDEGRIVFQDSLRKNSHFKEFVSNSSLLQHSQAYIFVRNRLHLLSLLLYEENKNDSGDDGENQLSSLISNEEEFYISLLEVFLKDLAERDIQVIFMPVSNHISHFEDLETRIKALHVEGGLHYAKSADWLVAGKVYSSPEGHDWNAEAHRMVGRGLAELILNPAANTNQVNAAASRQVTNVEPAENP